MHRSIEIQVFITSKNNPDLVRESINSVLAQTIIYCSEVIVSENSDDDSVFLMLSKEYPHIQIRRRESLTEFEHFRKILAEVSCPYFVIFSDTDVMRPQYLENTHRALISNDNYVAVGVNGNWNSNASGKLFFYGFKNQVLDVDTLVRKILSASGAVVFSGYMYRTSIYKDIKLNAVDEKGPWNLSFIISGMADNCILWLSKPLMESNLQSSPDASLGGNEGGIPLLSYIMKVSTGRMLFHYHYYIYRNKTIVNISGAHKLVDQWISRYKNGAILNSFCILYPIYTLYLLAVELPSKCLFLLSYFVAGYKIKLYNFLTNILWFRYAYRASRRSLLIVVEWFLRSTESVGSIYYCDRSCVALIYFYQRFGNFRVDQFGLNKEISQYVGMNLSNAIFFEHSLNFRDKPPQEEIASSMPVIGVMSEYRKKQIEKYTDKEVVAVGPYVLMAESYSSEKMRLELIPGKILLVFPMHTTETCEVFYDKTEFMREINSVSSSFSKVMVCLFYHDILKGEAKSFVDAGYEVVSAGHRYDPLFLSRLRRIIEMCDCSMSNGFGTHIGFCVALNKPHYVWSQNYIDFEKHPISFGEDLLSIYRDIVSLFQDSSFIITNEQVNICNKYWGLNNFCEPQQLRIRIQQTLHL